MTTLGSSAPPLLESTALPVSTVLPASTSLPPEHVCALGFIWVIELAACVSDTGSQQPRAPSNKCKEGYAFHVRFNQCLRKKNKGKQIYGIQASYKGVSKTSPKTTPRRPNTGYGLNGTLDDR